MHLKGSMMSFESRPVRKVLTKEDLLREEFIREIMVGDCPRCGSPNTHDCKREEFVPARLIDDGSIRPMSIIRMGCDCEVAKKLDDPTIGHCDDCNYLWCLECGSELSIDEPRCRHWEICETCGKTNEFPDTCPYKAEAEAGELFVNPCILRCPNIYKCSKCPYEADISDCPKIREV